MENFSKRLFFKPYDVPPFQRNDRFKTEPYINSGFSIGIGTLGFKFESRPKRAIYFFLFSIIGSAFNTCAQTRTHARTLTQ